MNGQRLAGQRSWESLARLARLAVRELVAQRLRVRHLQLRYRVVADRLQVLDQRAQRVANELLTYASRDEGPDIG
jgi:hypothetical protein